MGMLWLDIVASRIHCINSGMIMTNDELEIIKNLLPDNPGFPWWVYIVFAVLSLFGSFIGTYFSEKGKNTATKEDIEGLTAVVEGVKLQNQLMLESKQVTNRLRMAAIGERLNAHQGAYKLWRRIYSSLGEESLGEVVEEAQSWWEENCLYLEAKPREAFLSCITAAKNHQHYKDKGADFDLLSENENRILGAGGVIVEAVMLPSLNESQDLADNRRQAQAGATL